MEQYLTGITWHQKNHNGGYAHAQISNTYISNLS